MKNLFTLFAVLFITANIFAQTEEVADTAVTSVTENVIEANDTVAVNDIVDGESITDADGNVYRTVAIGNQVWMAEALRTTKYNDSTDIPLVTDFLKWRALMSPGFCYYDKEPSYAEEFGALYNYYTVATGKLCPKGWHVPTDDDARILIDGLGGARKAGERLKESGNKDWKGDVGGGNDITGFHAKPAGYRTMEGNFRLCLDNI